MKFKFNTLRCVLCLVISYPFTHAAPMPKVMLEPVKKDVEVIKIKPSRYIGEKDYDGYIKHLLKDLSMSKRAKDPFGQSQDPNAKPVIKSTSQAVARRIPVLQSVSFENLINRLKINAVMINERKFLTSNRMFQEGQDFPILFRGRNIKAQIKEVKVTEIVFLNLDTQEEARYKLDLLPTGMKSGKNDLVPNGMLQSLSVAPIEIDSMDQPGHTP
jgi:hypothetical protein